MRVTILLCLLAIVLYAQAEADPSEDESESELQRSARAVAHRAKRPRAHHAKQVHARRAKRPKARPTRRRRFKTRRNKHGRQYYQRMMGLKISKAYWKKRVRGNIYNALKNVYAGEELPTNFSWTDKPNIVTPAKFQGSCGSCYSFASVGAIESMLAIWNENPNLDLSEQEIVDCSQKFGNLGCDGGLMESVFQWVATNKGLTAEKAYPYKESVGKCHGTGLPKFAPTITFAQIPPGNEDGLRSVVYHLGPVGIGIHASLSTFFNYTEGIYDDEACNADDIYVDHAVLLVGWGEENGEPFWLIKNSWGPQWGENGFVKLFRGIGQCKIGQMAAVPVLKRVAKQLLGRKAVRHNFQ